MRAWGALAVIGVCVLAGAASAVPAAPTAKSPNGKALRALQGVNFISSCRTSHRAMDDPIVFPGYPGLSHDHTFVGNTTTNASSTLTLTPRRLHDVQASRRHGRVLDADAAR